MRRRAAATPGRLTPRRLSTGRHAVFHLAPGLLLVFKQRGHREAEHHHAHRQRLRVLRGRLVVRAGKKVITLHPNSRPLTLRARQPHTTLAVKDTWLVAESQSPRRRAPDGAVRRRVNIA